MSPLSPSVAQNTPVWNRGMSSNSGTEIGTAGKISHVTSAADYLDIAAIYLNKAVVELVIERDAVPTKKLGGYLRLMNGTRNKAKALRKLGAKLKASPGAIRTGGKGGK